MPCFSWREDKMCMPLRESDPIEEKTPDTKEYFKDRVAMLEAMLCAILTELVNEPKGSEIVNNAAEKGEVNIKSFWLNHQVKDEVRLDKELSKFSEHEKEVIKKILNRV